MANLTLNQIQEIYERASCAMIHPNQGVILLVDVCEFALDLAERLRKAEAQVKELARSQGK